MKFTNDKVCNACSKSKQTRSSFKVRNESAHQDLLLLYMDLCGQIKVFSRGGKISILVVIEDFSRYTWVMFLRTKNETTGQLIVFFKAVQSKLNSKIGSIRSDHGIEF